MANFYTAYSRTGKFEGGYVNDPKDNGGETYYGISRKFHPNWGGWKTIDIQKDKPNFPKNLKEVRDDLSNMEKSFYKTNFWDVVWGDEIKNQNVANDMYDTAVNMGAATSIKLSERQFKLKETGRMNATLLTKLNSVV